MKRRRTEQLRAAREVHPQYYASHPHPSYNQFGTPDFVDEMGREYRIAFDPPHQRDPRVSTALVELRAARGDNDSLTHPDATVDDLLLHYRDQSIKEGDPELVLQTTRPLEYRVRLWVRLPISKYADKTPHADPEKHRTVREQSQRWPKPDATLTLTFVGSEAIIPRAPGETIEQNVTVMRTFRSSRQRATGYVDIIDMPADFCDTILNRRMAILQ